MADNKSKPIDKLDKDGNVIATYRNTREAAASIGECAMHQNIRNVCKHKPGVHSAYGFKWRYHFKKHRPKLRRNKNGN